MTTPIFDADATARLTPYPALVESLKTATVDYANGRIASPERLVVPIAGDGIMLSMPAAAADIAIHKLVNVCPANGKRGLPTIHGQVMAFDAQTGETRFILDGPTVTGRRTAAITMLGIEMFAAAAPRDVLLIGTGTQSANHVAALAELYPQARLRAKATSADKARAFCDAHRGIAPNLEPFEDSANGAVPASVDCVITLTTSRQPVYDEAPRADRLVIGVGAFTPQMIEIGPNTVKGSALFVDDYAGSKHEAGDFIQAGIDWATITGMSAIASGEAEAPKGRPVVFKSVGCAAWDLAACRVARDALS